MSGKILALFYDPWAGLAEAPVGLRHPRVLWRKAQWFKANPRSAAYMRERLAEHWPAAEFIDAPAEPSWEDRISGAAEIVLLYPDAIGIGFGRIERRLRKIAPRTTIQVLTGRRRVFVLDGRTGRALRLRRFLERTMLLEAVMGIVLLVATPVLLAVDFARGRR